MDNEYDQIAFPEPQPTPVEKEKMDPEQRRTMMSILAIVAAVVVSLIAGIVYLGWFAEPTQVTRVRDIFIIFMALESLLIGLALVILMIQMARLINLVQNEIKPILDSTNETVSHLRGTTVFLSDNLVEPVIKLNEYLAGFSQLLQVIGLARKPSKPRSNTPKGE